MAEPTNLIETTDALPTELHGFTVETFVGPYPIDAQGSHRRAVYARLRPTTPELQSRLRWIGRTHILAHAELTADGLLELELDNPTPSADAEEARQSIGLAVIAAAAKKAKSVAEAR